MGNGVHADTIAIQDAINAAQAAGGGTVVLGVKAYKTTATLHITSSFVGIRGVTGASAGGIVCATASVDILQITGTSNAPIAYNSIQNCIIIRSVAATGTAKGINSSFANWLYFSNVAEIRIRIRISNSFALTGVHDGTTEVKLAN